MTNFGARFDSWNWPKLLILDNMIALPDRKSVCYVVLLNKYLILKSLFRGCCMNKNYKEVFEDAVVSTGINLWVRLLLYLILIDKEQDKIEVTNYHLASKFDVTLPDICRELKFLVDEGYVSRETRSTKIGTRIRTINIEKKCDEFIVNFVNDYHDYYKKQKTIYDFMK